MNAPREVSHDDIVVSMLKAAPAFAEAYLAAAFNESDLPGVQFFLHQIAEAQGMANVAEKAGMTRESLYRTPSNNGNPTIKTLLAVLNASGLHSPVARLPVVEVAK